MGTADCQIQLLLGRAIPSIGKKSMAGYRQKVANPSDSCTGDPTFQHEVSSCSRLSNNATQRFSAQLQMEEVLAALGETFCFAMTRFIQSPDCPDLRGMSNLTKFLGWYEILSREGNCRV